MKSISKLSSIALMTAFAAIGTTASAQNVVADYFVDRGHDILDIFRIRAGAPSNGEGYGAKARLTSAAQLGYVNFDGYYAGLNRRGIGVSHEDREEGGISFLYFSEHTMETKTGNVFLHESTDWAKIRDRRLERNLPYWDDGQGDPLGIGAEIATPILALDAGIYPVEAVDFVLGIFTIDIYEDDRLSIQNDPWDPMVPTTPPSPDLEAATSKLTKKLEEQRAGFAEDEVEALEEGAVPASMPSVEERVEEILERDTTQSASTEPGVVEIENEEDLDQDAVNEILENSTPVEDEVEEVEDAGDQMAPAVEEVTENQ